ncbi:MAG: AlwI family type II restriction endonuclease, partial [Patescibacteria group bacterium]
MKKIWSISTTVRNPERIRNFLLALKPLDGEVWNHETQRKFQILLIQHKLYGAGNKQFTNNLSPEHRELLENSEALTYEQAEEILDARNYVG